MSLIGRGPRSRLVQLDVILLMDQHRVRHQEPQDGGVGEQAALIRRQFVELADRPPDGDHPTVQAGGIEQGEVGVDHRRQGVAVQDRHVVRLAERVDSELPVDVARERSRAEVAIRRQAERGELGLRSGERLVGDAAVGVGVDPDQTVTLEHGNGGQPTGGLVVEVMLAAAGGGGTVELVGPAVVRAAQPGCRTATVRDLGAAVAADVEHGVQVAVGVAGDDHRAVTDLDGGVGVGAGQQAGETGHAGHRAQELPFVFESVGVGVGAGRQQHRPGGGVGAAPGRPVGLDAFDQCGLGAVVHGCQLRSTWMPLSMSVTGSRPRCG